MLKKFLNPFPHCAFAGIIIVASLTDNRDIRETNIISGCVMIIACLIAIYSGRFKDRWFLFIYSELAFKFAAKLVLNFSFFFNFFFLSPFLVPDVSFRGGLQMTYILYVWQLGNGSVLLYAGLKDNSKLSDYCEKLRDPSDCNGQLKLAKAQAGLGTLR